MDPRPKPGQIQPGDPGPIKTTSVGWMQAIGYAAVFVVLVVPWLVGIGLLCIWLFRGATL
jgi:hypothetical protein